MAFWVYIAYSSEQDIFYKGQSTDPDERMIRHQKGYEDYTGKFDRWILLWKTQKDSRSQAVVLERKLKNLTRQRTIDLFA